jgi:hypothetical protein
MRRRRRTSPNNTDVASDILVASLLDVAGEQRHVGATALIGLRHEPHGAPLKFEEPVCEEIREDSQETFLK